MTSCECFSLADHRHRGRVWNRTSKSFQNHCLALLAKPGTERFPARTALKTALTQWTRARCNFDLHKTSVFESQTKPTDNAFNSLGASQKVLKLFRVFGAILCGRLFERADYCIGPMPLQEFIFRSRNAPTGPKTDRFSVS